MEGGQGDTQKGKEGSKKTRERGNREEKRIHVPLLQHKSPEEADHGTSCRTRLLIRHSHTYTHRENWTPSILCPVRQRR